MTKFSIILDAGHGPNTPGKRSPDGMREYEFNSRVADVMKAELEKYEGVTVCFAHDSRRDVPLKERTDRANKLCVDLYFSIHADALAGVMGDHGGITSFVYTPNPKSARKLADVVQRNLIAATKLRNRGVKPTDFHVLRETHMDAILVEHGFMDSRTDLPFLKSDAYRVLCGQTNVKSIAEVYGLRLKASAQPKPSQVATGVICHIDTGGYAGPQMAEVHDYLFEGQHGYDVKRGVDGSLVFLIGPFDTGMQNFADCKAWFAKRGFACRILTREAAVEWRAK